MINLINYVKSLILFVLVYLYFRFRLEDLENIVNEKFWYEMGLILF